MAFQVVVVGVSDILLIKVSGRLRSIFREKIRNSKRILAPVNQTKKSQFMNFSQGHSLTKVRYVNRACFPKEKHQNLQKWAKFMNFSFWPFLWFGLPGRLLTKRIFRANFILQTGQSKKCHVSNQFRFVCTIPRVSHTSKIIRVVLPHLLYEIFRANFSRFLAIFPAEIW